MNRQEVVSEVLAFCQLYAIPRESVVLTAGSAMVMYGLREETRDLDMCLTSASLKAVLSQTNEQPDLKGYLTIYSKYDIHEVEDEKFCVISGLRVVCLHDLLRLKRQLSKLATRSQDKTRQDLTDIAMIDFVMSGYPASVLQAA